MCAGFLETRQPETLDCNLELRTLTAQPLCEPQTPQEYLSHKKQRPPWTLQQECAQGPMVVLGKGSISHERGTPEP